MEHSPPDRDHTVWATFLSALAAMVAAGAVAALVAAIRRAEEASGISVGEVVPIAVAGLGAMASALGAWYAARSSSFHPVRGLVLLLISLLLSLTAYSVANLVGTA